MENIAKYIMGVAAKSNVEKRQVGCIIVHGGVIIAEGFNTEQPNLLLPSETCVRHAEVAACIDLKEGTDLPLIGCLKAYVTHPPCPECAKVLAETGITEIEVVEQFMKFDGDKLRFDLIDGEFGQTFLLCEPFETRKDFDSAVLKSHLYNIAKNPKPDRGMIKPIDAAIYMAMADCTVPYIEEEIAKVLTFGARKYKANNWRNCVDTGRYLAAAHRHLNSFIAGQVDDPETGLNHLSHILTNLMFLHALGLKYDT